MMQTLEFYKSQQPQSEQIVEALSDLIYDSNLSEAQDFYDNYIHEESWKLLEKI
jgi:hypothetical protein